MVKFKKILVPVFVFAILKVNLVWSQNIILQNQGNVTTCGQQENENGDDKVKKLTPEAMLAACKAADEKYNIKANDEENYKLAKDTIEQKVIPIFKQTSDPRYQFNKSGPLDKSVVIDKLAKKISDYERDFACSNGVKVSDPRVVFVASEIILEKDTYKQKCDRNVLANSMKDNQVAGSFKGFNGQVIDYNNDKLVFPKSSTGDADFVSETGKTFLLKKGDSFLGCEFTKDSLDKAKLELDNNRSLTDFAESGYQNKNPVRVAFCDKSKALLHYKNKQIIYPPPPCGAKLGIFFDDNESKIDDKKLNPKQKEEYENFKKCVEYGLKLGFQIQKVNIASSCSQLNNGPSSGCGERDFICLANKRAESALGLLNNIITDINKNNNKNIPPVNENIVRKDILGENCDGSSGPCPYEKVKDKKMILKSEYEKDGLKRKELDKFKNVSIQVNFKTTKDGPSSTIDKLFISQACYVYSFSCKDGSAKKPCSQSK
jgi:hypothetical protein